MSSNSFLSITSAMCLGLTKDLDGVLCDLINISIYQLSMLSPDISIQKILLISKSVSCGEEQ